jgi:threonyl-tRNA synthetase
VSGPEHGSLGARIRARRLVPYQAVIGAREADEGAVTLRLRDGSQLPAMSVEAALAGIGSQVAARGTALWDERRVTLTGGLAAADSKSGSLDCRSVDNG